MELGRRRGHLNVISNQLYHTQFLKVKTSTYLLSNFSSLCLIFLLCQPDHAVLVHFQNFIYVSQICFHPYFHVVPSYFKDFKASAAVKTFYFTYFHLVKFMETRRTKKCEFESILIKDGVPLPSSRKISFMIGLSLIWKFSSSGESLKAHFVPYLLLDSNQNTQGNV